MVQKKLPSINNAHGPETRNIINELIKLFNGMGYTYDEALQKAHDVLSEAQRTNRLNNNTNSRLDKIIADSGTSSTEVVDARGENDVLSERLNTADSVIKNTSVKTDVNLIRATRSVSESKTMVTFIDDDGYDAVLDVLKPMATSRGVPYCVALRGDAQVLQTKEKIDDLRDLQNNHGWEMMSHTMNHIHLNSSTDKQLENDSTNFLELMNKHALNVESIVYPWGERGNTGVLSKYYRAGFGTANGVNNITLDDYNIGREQLGNSSSRTLQFFKNMIDDIEGKPVWLVFMTHIADSNTDVQQVQDVLDYVISKNIQIVTAKEGLKNYGSIINSRENKSVEPQHFRIKPNGFIDTNKYLMNEYSSNLGIIAKPSEFNVGTTSRAVIGGELGSGVLITTKPNASQGYAQQYYYPVSSQITSPISILYRKGTSGSDNWTNWSDLMGVQQGSVSEDMPATDYQFGESLRMVTNWSKGGGTVKTIRATTTAGYARQVFYSTGKNNVYTRRQLSSGAWSSWSEIQLI